MTSQSKTAHILCYASAVAALVCAAVLSLRLASLASIAVATGSLLLFALPGVVLAKPVFGNNVRRQPEIVILGAAMGLAMSEYAAIVIGYLHGWSVWAIALCVVLVTALAWVAARKLRRKSVLLELKPWQATDYATLFGMFLVLTLFLAVPFLNVGKLTPDGYSYTWLFGFDFLLRSAIASSMTLGLPPDYLHLSGEPLRYYLASYSLPAFAYGASGKSSPMHAIMLVQQMALGFLLIGCLFSFLRRFVRNAAALCLTSFTIVLFYSYYGYYPILKRLLLSTALPLPAWITNPATHGTYGGMSHLYQRLFLVEPQAMTGVCVLLVVMFVADALNYSLKNYAIAVILGLMLGVEFGIEGWQGIILASWFGLVILWSLFRKRTDLRSDWRPALCAVAVCCAIYASFFGLGMYELSSSKALLITPYKWVIKYAVLYFPVEYGPMLLLGVWGVVHQWRRGRDQVSIPLSILAGLSLVQIFFVTAAVLPEFGLLRGNRILPIALLVWTGHLLDVLLRGGSRKRLILAGLLLVLAAPTVFTDIYYSSNVTDRENTRYLRPADRDACDWIKRNIPESAVVQSEPDYIGQDDVSADAPVAMSLIANFADRRMAVGEQWIASTILVNSKERALQRFVEVHRMFRATDSATVALLAQRNRLDYIYVGPYEQHLYPGFLRVVQSTPQQFQPVYSAGGVYIFRYMSPDNGVPVASR